MKLLAALSAVVLLATASVALAARPVKGATYRGTIQWSRNAIDKFPIAFKVSRNGRDVTGFRLADSFPVYCQGGGFPAIGSGGSGKVGKQGTFTAKLPLKDTTTQKPEGFIVVTGRFVAGDGVSGKVRTDLPGNIGKACDGTSPFGAKT
jgi:hypothetical protein